MSNDLYIPMMIPQFNISLKYYTKKVPIHWKIPISSDLDLIICTVNQLKGEWVKSENLVRHHTCTTST